MTLMCLENIFYFGFFSADLVNGAVNIERCGTDQQYVTGFTYVILFVFGVLQYNVNGIRQF